MILEDHKVINSIHTVSGGTTLRSFTLEILTLPNLTSLSESSRSALAYKVFITSHTKLTVTCILYIIMISQLHGYQVILHLLICLFHLLHCDISLAGLKITQAIHFITCYSQKHNTISNPGILIFQISTYL